jgi:predicted nucleic acid-binding protein
VIVVSDTGPLIALAKADQLPLLQQLFGQIHVPPAVHRESLAESGPEADRLDDALTQFIGVAPVPPTSPELR